MHWNGKLRHRCVNSIAIKNAKVCIMGYHPDQSTNGLSSRPTQHTIMDFCISLTWSHWKSVHSAGLSIELKCFTALYYRLYNITLYTLSFTTMHRVSHMIAAHRVERSATIIACELIAGNYRIPMWKVWNPIILQQTKLNFGKTILV